MAEAITGAAIGATIDVLLHNLLKFPMKDFSRFWKMDKEFRELKETVATIRDFLNDAETKYVAEKPIKRWLKKLEAVAIHADNVLDELNYMVLRNKIKNQVRSFFSTSNPILFRHTMIRKIKAINKEFKSTNEEAFNLGLQVRLARAEANVCAQSETDSFAIDRVFVGRDEDVTRIVEIVTRGQTKEVFSFSVLPIVGMGGLGKTTLARTVYNDDNVIAHFGERVWVHVSEDFDPTIVFKNIHESLTGEKVDGCREATLRKLQERIGNNRYLLVLDNVWNEDIEKWDNFMASLEGISVAKGNALIVTTRKKSVASIVKTLDTIELGVLSEEDCWLIFKTKAFGEENISLEFESLGKIIAKKCGGLPLAAKVVGSLLRGKSKSEWHSIEGKWLSDFGGDENYVSNILRLSFDDLPSSSLKKCFAYCSIVPKGRSISRNKLIELWMAQGFCQENDMGNQAFNLLVQSSLLHVETIDYYGNVKHYGMHDLVRDLAFSILHPLSFDDIEEVRCIFPTPVEDTKSSIPKENVTGLRTVIGLYINIKFSKFKCLHVLILISLRIKELPIQIGKLIHLRFLDISLTKVEYLPDSIGDLHHFQTLRATLDDIEGSCLKKLPETLKHLISLRHLYVSCIKLPAQIGKLTSLQTLPHFQVLDNEGYRITELGGLKNLNGEISIYNLEKVHDRKEAKAAQLCHKPNLYKVKLVWSKYRRGNNINDEDVLDGLQSHPNIKSLEINGFRGTSFPLWISKMIVGKGCWTRSLDNLIEIKLTSCKECDDIPMLGHLPQLKSLYLQGLTNVKSIGPSFYGIEEHKIGKETIMVFPALERLELQDMINLTTWEEVGLPTTLESQPSHEVSMFHCLEYLKLINCINLRSAPSHFPCLKELEIENMKSDLPLSSICGSKLTSLTKLKLVKVDGMTCLPSRLFHNNPHLFELSLRTCNNLTSLVPHLENGGASLTTFEISSCPSFKEFPEDLHNLKSLKDLKLYSCPNLKSIPCPSDEKCFISLRCLEIVNCNALINLPSKMMESCVQSLEYLGLSLLQSLTNVPQVTSSLQKMTHLIGLRIEGIPKFIDMAAEIGSLPNTQRLWIDSKNYLDLNSINTSLDHFFPISKSLRKLVFDGLKQCEHLPNQIQHLTTLTVLTINKMGIGALPEWLGNLQSLEILTLQECRKLRRLPSKAALLRLTKLNFLCIKKCPLLMQDMKKSYFVSSKVSHIPTVFLNGELL